MGLELAKLLQARGDQLILLARDPVKLEQAKRLLEQVKPTPVHTYSCDVSDEERLTEVFTDIRTKCRSIDFLVLNAGVATVELFADYKSLREVTENIKINLLGAVATAYLATPLLVSGSHILFVSSGFGLVGAAGYSVYATAKGGMNNFADALRREMLVRGVSVHVACPGDIDTPMLESEYRMMPDWIKQKLGRAKPMPAEQAARYMLDRCEKGQYLIVPSKDVTLLILLQKLPKSLSTYLIDRILPLPPPPVGSSV